MKYLLKPKNENLDNQVIAKLASELKIKTALAHILCGRGICSKDAARLFLAPENSQLNDPFLFESMKDSVSLIKHTIAAAGKILIYGDYDVDGTAGCAIVYKALKKMGADVFCVLPSRMEHGYGLSMQAVEQMADCSLLITVDCGITNIEEIDRLRELGVKTIITDHHECSHVLPKADFIINAKREGEPYPYKELCGAGVAFKLACALIGDEAFDFIDLAAIATIADIVALNGENRVIAKLGLDRLNESPNLGIYHLIKKIGIKTKIIDSQVVAYSLAPRINAAGRIANAKAAFDLMVGVSESELELLAEDLCNLNIERQMRQEQMFRQVIDMECEMESDKLILMYNEDWDAGIIGLAASKVAEKYSKPTILFGKVGESYVGSARSISGVNIYEALATQRDMYEKFGGHAGAAGLTICEEHLPTLRQRLNMYLDNKYGDEIFVPVKFYDIELELKDINKKLLDQIERLRPFGYKNEQVEILFRDVKIEDVHSIADGKHSRFTVEKDGKKLNAVAFGRRVEELPQKSDIVGIVRINTFDNLPQVIIETMSFGEITKYEYLETRDRLLSGAKIKEAFLNRDKLLEVFSLLKHMSDKKLKFSSMREIFAILQKHIIGIDAKKAAFALLVLEEIELLDIINDGKINIVVHSGKHSLDESEIYTEHVNI